MALSLLLKKSHESRNKKFSFIWRIKGSRNIGIWCCPNYGWLYGDEIIALKAAFDREWVAQLHEEVLNLYELALVRPGGAVGRGPKRHYVEIHPEDISGFAQSATHPCVVAVCEAILGPDYKIVKIGFDLPNPGSADQP